MGMGKGRILVGLGIVAALALAGCGGDSSEDVSTQVSIATPTSPLQTTAPAAPAQGQQGSKQQKTKTTVAGPGGCEIPDTYQNFKFTGVDCTTAVTVAKAWDANGKNCNTIDNPESPQGFKKTCSVNGYSCEAKRDVRSDGRFVTCTQGGKSVRFTWYPV